MIKREVLCRSLEAEKSSTWERTSSFSSVGRHGQAWNVIVGGDAMPERRMAWSGFSFVQVMVRDEGLRPGVHGCLYMEAGRTEVKWR